MRGRDLTKTWAAAALSAVVAASAAAGPAALSAADPDFPTIPTRASTEDPGSGGEAEAGAAERPSGVSPDGGEGSDEPASEQDCAVIKSFFSRVDVVLAHQIPVVQGFPVKEDGERAVSRDLDVLNSVLPFIVYAETSLQDPVQRAKVTAYKGDLGQLSQVIAERSQQSLVGPAPYEWAEKLSEANNRAGTDYLKIGSSCRM